METNQTFEDLAQVVEHELFPDVDLALRRGRHIDREDAAWYGFLTDAQAQLERFYRRYGAELVQRTDGFFFLLPSGDKLGRRHLSPSEMLVGQGLTLLYLEPATVEQGGVTSRDQVLSQLSASMGTEALMLAFNAKKKRLDERVAQEMVRAGVTAAIRRLASLGFVELLPEERIRLRSSLMRFAEPVRGSGADLEALTRLVASGEVALTEDGDETSENDDAEAPPPVRRDPYAAVIPQWNEGSEWGASFAAEPDPEAEAETEAEEPAPTSTSNLASIDDADLVPDSTSSLASIDDAELVPDSTSNLASVADPDSDAAPEPETETEPKSSPDEEPS